MLLVANESRRLCRKNDLRTGNPSQSVLVIGQFQKVETPTLPVLEYRLFQLPPLAKRLGAAIIHYSTAYVFDGTKATPYTEQDQPDPQNIYGKTKLAGELAIQAVDLPYLILRTSWVYGLRGKNFLLTMLKLAAEREEVRVVDDQEPNDCPSHGTNSVSGYTQLGKFYS